MRPLRRSLAPMLLLVGSLLAPSPGAVHAADVFTVTDVPVDVTAEAADVARSRAHLQGQREAFSRVIQRLVPRGRQQAVPQPSPDQLANLIASFRVTREKASQVRYLAELTVSFKPDAIRGWLRSAGIAFAETPSKPVVVVPVYQAEGRTLLWEDPNPWLQAWGRLDASGGLVPLRIPLGDLSDISTLTADQALLGNTASLDALAERYGASQTLVAFARRPDGESGSLAVTISRYGEDGLVQTAVDRFERAEPESEAAFLRRAADSVFDSVEEAWKRDNLLDFSSQSAVTVTVPFEGLPEWLEIRRRLRTVPLIARSDIVRLSHNAATLDLYYVGAQEQLALALEQIDLVLVQAPTGWVLRRAESRRSMRAR